MTQTVPTFDQVFDAPPPDRPAGIHPRAAEAMATLPRPAPPFLAFPPPT